MSIVFTLVELITFTIFIDYLEAVCNAEQIHLDVLWPLPPDLLSDFLKKKAGNTKTNTFHHHVPKIITILNHVFKPDIFLTLCKF